MAITVTHNMLAYVNGEKTRFGTVEGYAREYKEDEQAAIQRELGRGFEIRWINVCATVLSGDPGYYDREAAKWAGAPQLKVGDIVQFDEAYDAGELYAIQNAPNGNFRLHKIG